MNNFKRKKMLSDEARRKFNSKHPSRNKGGWVGVYIDWFIRCKKYNDLRAKKYNRHGFKTPRWWTPDELNDVAM